MTTQTITKYARIAAASSAVALAGVQTSFAADFTLPGYGSQSVNANDTDATSTITTIAQSAINIILTVAGVLAVFYLIYSGILYITAGGNAERTKQARAGIINAIIGIVVILAAFFIVRFATSIGTTVSNSDNGVSSTATSTFA